MSGSLLVFISLDGMNQWVLARGSLLTKAFWIKDMPTRLRKGVPGECTLPPGFVHNPGASANGLLKIDCERWPQIYISSIYFSSCWTVLMWLGIRTSKGPLAVCRLVAQVSSGAVNLLLVRNNGLKIMHGYSQGWTCVAVLWCNSTQVTSCIMQQLSS